MPVSYVDDWNEQQRKVAEKWREQSRTLHESLAEVRVRIATQGDELAVTTDAQGRVADLEIAPKALGLGNETLRRMLLQTIRQAQAEAARRAEGIVAEMSPEAAATLRAAQEFVGEDETPHARQDATAGQADPDDDEKRNDSSAWLRKD